MSAMQQMLAAGRALVAVSGSLSGSGSLSIPAGVTSITLTGSGGPGYSSTTFSGTWNVTNVVALSSSYYVPPNVIEDGTRQQATLTYGASVVFVPPAASPAYAGQTASTYRTYYWNGDVNSYQDQRVDWTSSGTSTTTDYAGTSTTATFQAQTKTFAGASAGVTTAPSATVQTLTGLSGASGSMTYSVASGGSLSYSYTY